MTIEELRSILGELCDGGMDTEGDHIEADKALLKYINDLKVTRLFNKLKKWYG